VIPVLADKADITFSSELRGHSAFRVHVDASSLSRPSEATMHLLAHLYAQRSATLWKTTENAAWIKTVAMSVLPSVPSEPAKAGSYHVFRQRFERLFASSPFTNIHFSIYRHVATLTDSNLSRRLMGFVPKQIFEASQSNLACDPVPPQSSVSRYDDDFFRGTSDVFAAQPRSRRQREADERDLARMIPDANVRRQLVEMFNNHPQLLDRFPGGVAQFAQALGDMPEELVENLMMGAGMFNEGGNGNMPGAMPDLDEPDQQAGPAPFFARNDPQAGDPNLDDEVAIDESDEDDEDANEMPATAVQMVRNVLNRFWGFAGAAMGRANGSESDSDVGSEHDGALEREPADDVD